MKKLSFLILVFAVLFAIFFLLLIFLRVPFGLYPLMSYQDAIDLLTPLVLIPIYWLLFRISAKGEASRVEEMAFMVLAALWVLGHGMHLAANSINNLVEHLAKNQQIDILATDIYTLIYFYDEKLSHFLWYSGILGLMALLSYREWKRPSDQTTGWWMVVLAGLIHGFTLFCIFLEGQAVVMGLPFTAIFTLLVLIWGRKKRSYQPLLAFFLIACILALSLFLGWGLYWGGFPEFSEVGLI
ncbi:MAG: hypothetical protein ACK2U1_16170 [Anaerolineales bacterium]|jgi:hypothetical protein